MPVCRVNSNRYKIKSRKELRRLAVDGNVVAPLA